ncbi:GNAT family N-acetyltransferase [Streptomyces exfoliatus]|uniref:GNAT family N-acetyltransferase n=1 Tax=Streptomyces vilmorinianum TaxID=3051092 RepID=UPI0010FB1C66
MTAGGLRSEICRDGAEFGRLGARWASLYARCSTATPFQSHSWLHSWWVSYGTPGALRVVLVRREDGELVAAAPLMRARGPLPVLTQLGGAITDFTDVLLDDACPQAAPALARALARAARGAVIDLREVRPGAAAERVFAGWRGPRRRLADSLCLELPAVPMDALLERIPSGKAQRVRAKLRKLDALGIDEHIVTGEEVPAALERLLKLHQLQWQGRGVTVEHTSDRFAQHLARAVRPMVECGDARVTEFRLAGDVVAADLTLMSPRLAGGYLYGADPVLRARKIDVATMLLRHGARETSASGRATLSMLRGTEPYKQHWRPETVPNQRLILAAGPGTAPLLWLRAGAANGRRWAARQTRERAWVGRAVSRLPGRTNGGGG